MCMNNSLQFCHHQTEEIVFQPKEGWLLPLLQLQADLFAFLLHLRDEPRGNLNHFCNHVKPAIFDLKWFKRKAT